MSAAGEDMVMVLGPEELDPECDDIYVHVGSSVYSDCVVIKQGRDEIVVPFELWGQFVERAAGVGVRVAMAVEVLS